MSVAAKQMTFDMPVRSAQDREDFWVSPSNEMAVAWIDKWPDWPSPFLILYGPASSGKSHLKTVWDQKTNSFSIDDVDQTIIGDRDAEEQLFHRFNTMKSHGETGLLTASTPPQKWNFIIPDLRSRLVAQSNVSIDLPDDTLLRAIIIKQFNDRQLSITPEVLEYAIPRVERSFKAIQNLVEKSDKLALAQKKKVTISIMRQVLEDNV